MKHVSLLSLGAGSGRGAAGSGWRTGGASRDQPLRVKDLMKATRSATGMSGTTTGS